MLTPLRWLPFGLSLVCVLPAFSQCYDLASTRLYESRNRFEEHWDRPIWDAKPGEGNFHIENDGYGRALQFAIFTVKTVRKTSQGWQSYRSSREPEIRVDLTPEQSGSHSYMVAYETVPPSARLQVANDEDVETWSVSAAGLLQYTRRSRGHSRLLGSRPSGVPSPLDFETTTGEEDNRATLDLNTGIYHYEQKSYCKGCYNRKFKDHQLWRTITFTATARLKEIPCSVSVQKASLHNGPIAEVPEIEMKERGVCAAKVTAQRGEGIAAVPTKWEFLQNPTNAVTSEGCVLVFENTPPSKPSRIAQRQR